MNFTFHIKVYRILPLEIIAAFFVIGYLSTIALEAQTCTLVPMVLTPKTTPATCGAGGTASITVTSGGSPPYTYTWLPNVSATNTANNLAPGTYTVSVMDTRCHIPPGKELVVNGDFSAGNTGFSSNYTFCNTPLCLVPENMYAVGSNPTFYHNNFSGTDHTTGTGNFMIINGSTTPNVNLWCQTVANIAPNSNYVFSAWVRALNDISPAEFQFSINGAPLGTTFNGPSFVSDGWLHFCEVWNSGASTSASICIVNQSTALDGNDFGLDDISFRLCSPTTVTFTIGSSPAVVTTTKATGGGCGTLGSASVLASGGTPGYTYLWSTGATKSSITGLTAGNYSVTVTDAVGCISTNTVAVTSSGSVNAVAGTNTVICASQAQPVTLTASGGSVYLWSTLETSPVISVLPHITTTYSVVVSEGTCADTAYVTVTVNPVPQSSFSSTTVCYGNPTQFNDLSTISSGSISGWIWNFGDPTSANNSSSQSSPTHQFSSPGNYVVILTVTSDQGCQNISSFPVTLNAPPHALFTSTPVCLNSSTSFTSNSTSSGNDPINTWDWNYGDGSTHGSGATPSHTYTASGNYTVALVVTTAGGCKDSVRNPVTVYGIPVPAYSNPAKGCMPVCTTFQNQTLVPTGESIANWQWNCPGATPSTSTDKDPSFCWNAPGTYDVQLIVTTNHGCTDMMSTPKYIEVYSWPTADFCVDPSKAPNTNPVFNFCNLWSNNVASWTWDFGDNSPLDTSSLEPVHSYSATATNNDFYKYNICLTVKTQYGCADTVCKLVDLSPEFTFYIPNTFTPNDDITNDLFYGKSQGVKEYNIWIFDRWGNQIWDCHQTGKNTDWDGPDREGLSSSCKWDGKPKKGGVDMNGGSGKVMQEDVYVWKVQLTDIFGKHHTYVGHVNIIR